MSSIENISLSRRVVTPLPILKINSKIKEITPLPSPNKHIAGPTHPSIDLDKLPEGYNEQELLFSKQENAFFRNYFTLLPTDHPTYIDCMSSLNKVCNAFELPKDKFSLDIYEYEYPDAHVSILDKKVRISNTLIEVVFAHEIGHVLLKHYDYRVQHANNKDDRVHNNWLKRKIDNYEEEYQADRMSAICMLRLKQDPKLIKEALLKIYSYKKTIDFQPFNSWLWAVNSHPSKERRIQANEKLARLLPYSRNDAKGTRNLTTLPDFQPFKKISPVLSFSSLKGEFYYWAILHDDENLGTGLNIFSVPIKLFPLANSIEKVFLGKAVTSLKEAGVPNNDIEKLKSFFISAGNQIHLNFQGIDKKDVDWIFKLLSKYELLDFGILENLEFPELDPEDLNKITSQKINNDTELQKQEEILSDWWEKSIGHIHNFDGFIDLTSKDIGIKGFSSTTCKNLILSLNPLRYHSVEEHGGIQGVLYLPYQPPPRVSALISLLLKQWFEEEKFLEKSDIHSLEKVFNLLRDYRLKQGFFLSALDLRLVTLIQKVFDNSKTDEEKMEIVTLCNNYQHEIASFNIAKDKFRGTPFYNKLESLTTWCRGKDVLFLPMIDRQETITDLTNEINKHSREEEINITNNSSPNTTHIILKIKFGKQFSIDTNKPGTPIFITLPFNYNKRHINKIFKTINSLSKIYKIESASYIFTLSNKDKGKIVQGCVRLKSRLNATKNEKIVLLTEKIPRNYYSKNWTQSIVKSIEKGAKGELDEEHTEIREIDPNIAAIILDEEEFEKEYFGEKRESYKPTRYDAINKKSDVISTVLILWEEVYRESYKNLSEDKLDFLFNTFRLKCAIRDQMIVKALGWKELIYIEDLEAVQNEIMQLNDLETLFKIKDAFSQNILSLTCSAKLYELSKEKGISTFLEEASNLGFTKDAHDFIGKIQPAPLRQEELITLLTCYPTSSYKRDELLSWWIDKAQNKTSRMQIASLLSEPPYSEVGSRNTETVALNESLIDGIAKLNQKDKEEALLYLLGHDEFYSMIDENLLLQTRFNDREILRQLRDKAIYGTKLDLEEKIGRFDEDDHYIDEKYIKSTIKDFKQYKVRKPDSIIFLMKYSGVPLDILFKQQKIATTRREQKDLMDYILRGEDGILRQENEGKPFLRATARSLVHKGKFSNQFDSAKSKKAVEGILACALENCPEEKLSDLLLDAWYLSYEENIDLPNLVAKLFQDYGPITVKFGQYLATRDIPQEWKLAFRNLSSKNTVSDPTLIYEYEYHIFGKESPFLSIGEKIAEGSIGAAYKGKINQVSQAPSISSAIDTTIKIQHPFIERELEKDIVFIKKIINFINQNPGLYNLTIPKNTHLYLKQRMEEEINPEVETTNNRKLREILQERSESGLTFIVPKHFPQASKELFLAFEYVPGIELDNESDLRRIGIDSKTARNETGLEIIRQILIHGTYQGDPNMGNFGGCLISQDEKAIAWYDSGYIGKLSDAERNILIQFIRDIINNPDEKSIASFLKNILSENQHNDDSYNKILSWVTDTNLKDRFSIENLENLFYEFTDFASKENFEISNSWIALMSTLGFLKPLIHDASSEELGKILLPALLS